MADEARELALLDKLEMRIALAKDDDKLQTLLQTFLPALLLKLNSTHINVRKKTIQVCQHVNKRIEAPGIRLLALPLIQQLREFGDQSVLLRHYNTRYVRLALSRLPDHERDEVVKSLIKDFHKYAIPATAVGAHLFYFLLYAIGNLKLPRRGDKAGDSTFREFLGLSDEDAAALSTWFGKMMLLPTKAALAKESAMTPGLSISDVEFLKVSELLDAWNVDHPLGRNFARAKSLILDFLDTSAFNDKERLIPTLNAISEINPAGIADRGKLFTKIASASDLDDKVLIKNLYETYLGRDGNDHTKTLAAPLVLRTRILTLLTKSSSSAKSFPTLLSAVLLEGLVDTSGGLPAERFNAAFVEFVVHAFRISDQFQLGSMGSSLAGTMKGFLENVQGWPTASPGVDLNLRGKLYQLIGLAANEGKVVDLQLLEFLLYSLNEDTSGRETLISIEEALSSMVMALSKSPLSAAQQSGVQSILVRFLEVKQHHKSLPFIIARLANRCLPYSNASARSINIRVIGTSGRTFETAEEGRKGLDPLWFKTTNSHRPDLWLQDYASGQKTDEGDFAFPLFLPLMESLFPILRDGERTGISESLLINSISGIASNMSEAFPLIIKFAFRILLVNTLQLRGVKSITENWERSMDVIISRDPVKRKALYRILCQIPEGDTLFAGLDALILSALKTFSLKKTPEILDGQECFVQLLTVSPRWRRQQFLKSFGLTDIQTALGSSERSTRDLAARAFGILAVEAAGLDIKVEVVLGELVEQAKAWNSNSTDDLNKACGAISALTHSLARLGSIEDFEMPTAVLAKVNNITCAIIFQSKNRAIQEAAFDAVGQLGIWLIYGSHLAFPVVDLKEDDKDITAEVLIGRIAVQAKAGNERAISALGRFSLWLDEEKHDSLLSLIYKELKSCHDIRQTESQFAVGEALSCLAFGSYNTAIETEFDSTEEIPRGPTRKKVLKQVLQETLKGCRESKPALQRASVIWLLSLVQFGGHHSEVQQLLTLCQRAFMSTLGNRDELVQEASARGLGLVYEKGDKKLKDALIEDLVASFSDTKPKMSGTVTEDTELFSEGILRTHDGSVSTYKDILDLASEVGDPSLVYRFMSLAANNAIWTSRAAFGNFGLSTILSDSGYLSSNPKLFPALYRYQFDPNPNVQRSMKSLWQSLVKEPQKILDDNFDSIMDELLKHVLGREWRAREASCRAIADLVQDRKFEKYEKYMDDIWTSCSKVMDDIKGSVRTAARTLALTLTNILVRSLEAGDSSKSTIAMLNHVIPFLLSPSGVEARAKDVQGWAVTTLLTVIKKSRGTVLETHVPLLLESIIGLFSSLEHEMVNYLHLNSDKYNMTTAEIDDLRLKAARASPLMDAVEKLIDSTFKDNTTPDKIVDVLEKQVRSSLGMPSQTATARILVSMYVRHHARYKPFADRFLRAIQKPLLDRNDAVASSYAYAAGYLARWASDDQVRKSAEYAWSLWETSENDRHRAVSAEVFAAVAKHAPERFASLSEIMLPYIFVGKHDDQGDVRSTFKSTWNESTSGPRAVLLHLDSIVMISSDLLDAPRWTLKHAGARSISEISETVAALDKAVSPAQAPKVWPALVKALGGKSWEGKEVVLKAFGAFVKGIALFWEKDSKVANEMTRIIFRESKRQNRQYQAFAFPVLGTYAAARTDLDMSASIFDIISPVIDELVTRDDEMDIDGDKETKIKESVRDDLCVGAIAAAAMSFSPKTIESKGERQRLNSISQRRLTLVDCPHLLFKFLVLAQKANNIHARAISIQLFESLEPLCKSFALTSFDNEKELAALLKEMLYKPQYASYGADTKLKRARVLTAIANMPGTIGKEVLGDSIGEEIRNEPADSVREELKRAKLGLHS